MRRLARSTWWWWGPASPGCTCSTGCARWASPPSCSRPATTSAAPGTGTATRAPAATSRPSTTRTRFDPELEQRVDVVGEVRHPAGDPPLPAARRRQARPAPRHPVLDPGRARPRGTRPRRRWHVAHRAPGDDHHLPLLRDGHRLPVGAEDARHRRRRPLPAATCTSPAAGRTRASTSPASGSAVIGTGSSGIQSIPLIAKQAVAAHRVPAHAELLACRRTTARRPQETLATPRRATAPPTAQAAKLVARRRAVEPPAEHGRVASPTRSSAAPLRRGVGGRRAAAHPRRVRRPVLATRRPTRSSPSSSASKIRAIVDDPRDGRGAVPEGPPVSAPSARASTPTTTRRSTCPTCGWSTCASTPITTITETGIDDRRPSRSSSTPSCSPPASTR